MRRSFHTQCFWGAAAFAFAPVVQNLVGVIRKTVSIRSAISAGAPSRIARVQQLPKLQTPAKAPRCPPRFAEASGEEKKW